MPIQIPVTQTGFEASIQAAAQKAGRNLKIDLGSSARSINALSQPLGRITGQADEFTKSMEAANARVLAFGASVGVLNSVIQGFKSLVATTIEVEKSLADINSVLQGSSAELNKFKKDIFDVAKETGNSFKTVSEAALELSRQGLPANEVVGRLKDSMILARLSGLDAAQSVEGLTAAINSFSKEGLTSSQILNKISNAAAKYAVSERDLIEGFKRSASVAQQAGVSIDELGGIITAVQQKSARGGAVIGNSFKTIFTRIQRPESLKLLEEIGVQVLDLKGNIVPATKLLEGLASKISSLDDVQVTSITEKIGGGFQIAPLLSALDDYNSKTSVARGATEAFMSATNQAYERNAALNQTMAAAINEASVNLKEFANTLGEIGVTKGLSNVLSFFNTFISDVQGLLEGEGLGSKFARSIVEGIGNVLSGPGLAVFGGIILKLTTDLVKFGTQSLKTFFNIGSAAKEINTLQGSIASTLLRNKDIQTQILALEGNRAAQARFFTTALNEQYSTMQKMQSIAASIAPAVYGATVLTKKSSGKNAADGYMPAVSQESRDISRGVGGARSGDRPVVIPNFAFGGGKKGTMVAHTGEYIVPNFAAGGSAIFNRDMVRSMGLPAGAKKIGAAGGFIPNFATKMGPAELLQSAGIASIKDLEKYRIPNQKSFNINGNILPESQAKQKLIAMGSVYNANLDPKTIMLIPTPSKYSQSGLRTIFKGSRKVGNKVYNSFEGGYAGVDPELKSGGLKSNSKFIKLSGIDSAMNNALATAANNILKSVEPDIKTQPATLTASSIGKYLEAGGAGALGSIRGALFESVINLITKGAKDKSQGTLDVSFDAGNNRAALEEIFGLEGQNVKFADFKNSIGQKDKFIDQVMKNRSITSAKGYIPNFADPLKEAIGREMSAGVPASQIYVDQNSSLKNSMNPMGLMVANRRDEPAGGIQGINRARREGANPMLYGASKGFVPNYAEPAFSSVNELGTKSKAIAANLENLNQKIAELNNSISKNKITYDQAQTELAQFIQAIDKTSTKTQQTVLNVASSKINKGVDLEKPQRDMLGTIFAVQAGLSLLTGATNDSSSALVRYTNVISNALGNLTTAAFAASAFKDMATTGKGLVGVFGKLGVAGAAVGAAFALFEGAKDLYYEFSGANKRAADAAKALANSASEAAVRLEDLNPEAKESIDRTVDDIIKKLNIDINEKESPEFKKAIARGLTGTSRTNVEAILKDSLESKNINLSGDQDPESRRFNFSENQKSYNILTGDPNKAIQALIEQGKSGGGAILMRDYLSLVKEAKTPEELTSFLANPKLSEKFGENLKSIPTADLFNLDNLNKSFEQISQLKNSKDFKTTFEAMQDRTPLVNSLKEQEASIAIIFEFVEKIRAVREETEKNASIELSKQEQALSQALQASLRKSALERPTKIMQQAGSLMESSLEISTKQKLLQINGDLSLSEDLRKQKLEEINHQYEISKIALQSQSKLAEKLNSSLEEISSGKVLGIDPKQGTEQARSFIQKFVSNAANKDTLEKLAAGNDNADFINELRSQVGQEAPLFKYSGQQDELIKLTKEYYELSQGVSIETAQQKNEKQKLYEISQKELSIEKQRQNLIERGNLYLKGAQNKLTSRIEDISNQSTLNEARKELELTIFDKTGKTVDPEENARAIEAINQKYFELQQQLNAEKAEAELRLEITRNLKIDNNITSLGANTTAIGSVQDALINNVLPVLNTLPKNMAEELKNAVLALNNGGQLIPQTASGGTQLDNNAVSGGAVVGDQKLNQLRAGITKNTGNNLNVSSVIKLENMEQLAQNALKFLGDKASIGDSKDGGYRTLYINGEQAPAGMRNNNPGNLIYGNDPSLSRYFGSIATSINKDNIKNGKGGDRQLVFDDPLTGMEAAVKLALNKYQKRDLKTVNQIIADPQGWTGGNFEAAGNIAKSMGVNPDQDIGLNDPKNLKNFLRSLLKQEHGDASLAYSDDLINTAIQNELNRRSGGKNQPLTQPATNNQVITTNSKYGAINPEGTGGQYRIHPLSSSEQGRKLFNLMEEVSRSMGLQYKISSALQEAGKGTGSVRHNKEVGAADIKLIKNGQTVNFTTAEGEKIAAEFVKKLVAGGVTGVGAGKTAANYMGPETMHVGYGKPAVWGGTKTKPGPVPDWLRNSFTQGRREAGYTTSGISPSALANQTLSTVDPIRQAAQRVSGFELGDSMTNAAIEEAKKLVDTTGKTTEEAKDQITKMAETIEAAAMSIISNGKTATTAAEQNRINIEKARAAAQQGTFASGFTTGMENLNKEIAGFSEQIGEKIPSLFADNMANAMEDIILNSEDLESSLRSAATAFLTEINRSNFKNLANIFTSGVQQVGSSIFSSFASGGPITGGSGTKDDVPALLMGGEFVMNKKSVSKYGMNFMNQLNNGSLPKFADGGSVSDISKVGKYTIFSGKTGSSVSGEYSEDGIPRQYDQEGRFFSPGTYGSGAIIGKNDLLKFATQSQTPGKNDIMVNQNGLSYVSLEPESTRLTVEGRLNSPEFQAVQRDKEEAFSLYLQQLGQEETAEEEYKAEKKAFRKAWQTALWTTVGTAALTSIAKPMAAGFQAGMGEAATKGVTGFSALGSGVSGMWSGGNIGGTQIGGLSNFFSGNAELANIGTASQLTSLFQKDPNSNLGQLISSNASNYVSNISVPKAIAVNRATGGLIPNTSGVDTVPAMLSGGEFVMNRAATQNIGVGTLQSLNAGGSSDSQSQNSTENTDKIISKLDELITAIKENMSGNVSVNVSSDGSSTKETTDNSKENDSSQSNSALAKRIKAAVIEVIQQEKRLGGSLRTT